MGKVWRQFLVKIFSKVRRKQAENAIKKSEAKFRSIVFLSQDAILVVDAKGKIGYMNPAAEKIFDQRVGSSIQDSVVLPFVDDKLIEISIPRLGKDRGVGEMHITKTEWLGETGQLIMIRDITEQKSLFNKLQQSKKRLAQLARQDALTGLPNFYQFTQIIDKSIAYATRYNINLVVLSMDLDGFKDINDTYGHDVGDLLLKEVAARFLVCARKEDFVARVGGDEFIMLAAGVKNQADSGIIAQKLIEAIRQKYFLGGHEIYISISIGIAFFPSNGSNKNVLLKKADIAMYSAKRAGKNRYHIYED